jgi:hypothetical protein
LASNAPGAVVLVFALVAGVVIAATWVYHDARARSARGRPVISSIGSVRVHTPLAWFVACLVAPEFALPAYADGRGPH